MSERDEVFGMCSVPVERLDQLLAAERENRALQTLVAAYIEAVADYRRNLKAVFGELAQFQDTA
jgi:hypothetical protein